jgi:hypothetical protein
MARRHARLARRAQRVLSEVLEPRRLLAAVAWDAGGDGVNWSDPANWSTNALPTAADDVTIAVPDGNPTIVVKDSEIVHSLTSNESLSLSGGKLELVAPSSIAASLTLAGGELAGGGTVTVSGDFDWTGGTMSGSGSTRVLGTSTLSTESDSDQLSMGVGRTLRFEGDASLAQGSGGYKLVADLSFTGDAPAQIQVAAGHTFTLAGEADLYWNGGPVRPILTVEPGATLSHGGGGGGGGGGESRVDWTLDNRGTVNLSTGTLDFTGDSNVGSGVLLSAGRYLVASGTTLDFASAITTLTADIEIDGTGLVPDLASLDVDRGRVGLTGGADLDVTPGGGTLTLEGIIDLSPDSVLHVNGNMRLAGASQPVYRTEIASTSSFGKLTIVGSLDLNSPDSSSRFDPDLVGGFDPSSGSRFDVISANSVTGGFDQFFGGTTPGNLVMLATRPDAQTVAVEIGTGTPPPPPEILSQSFDYQTREALVFTFDQDVSAFLSRKDYTLQNLTTGEDVPQSVGQLTYNLTSNEATLLLTGQLPDGNYRLTIRASDIANAAGVPATGNGITFDFFVRRGDANHDRSVDFNDLVALAQNYNTAGKTFIKGDFNYDSNVDFNDLVILAQRYNTTLAEPAVTGGAFVASASEFSADWAAAAMAERSPEVALPPTPTRKVRKAVRPSVFAVVPISKPKPAPAVGRRVGR